MHYIYLTGKHLKLLNGKRYHLEPASGHSLGQEMHNKGFSFLGGRQHTEPGGGGGGGKGKVLIKIFKSPR